MTHACTHKHTHTHTHTHTQHTHSTDKNKLPTAYNARAHKHTYTPTTYVDAQRIYTFYQIIYGSTNVLFRAHPAACHYRKPVPAACDDQLTVSSTRCLQETGSEQEKVDEVREGSGSKVVLLHCPFTLQQSSFNRVA